MIRTGGNAARFGRADLGVDGATLPTGGVAVEGVLPGGPAARAGVEPGDVMVAVADEPTPSVDALASVMETLRPGHHVAVQLILPQGRQTAVRVTLGRQPGA